MTSACGPAGPFRALHSFLVGGGEVTRAPPAAQTSPRAADLTLPLDDLLRDLMAALHDAPDEERAELLSRLADEAEVGHADRTRAQALLSDDGDRPRLPPAMLESDFVPLIGAALEPCVPPAMLNPDLPPPGERARPGASPMQCLEALLDELARQRQEGLVRLEARPLVPSRDAEGRPYTREDVQFGRRAMHRLCDYTDLGFFAAHRALIEHLAALVKLHGRLEGAHAPVQLTRRVVFHALQCESARLVRNQRYARLVDLTENAEGQPAPHLGERHEAEVARVMMLTERFAVDTLRHLRSVAEMRLATSVQARRAGVAELQWARNRQQEFLNLLLLLDRLLAAYRGDRLDQQQLGAMLEAGRQRTSMMTHLLASEGTLLSLAMQRMIATAPGDRAMEQFALTADTTLCAARDHYDRAAELLAALANPATADAEDGDIARDLAMQRASNAVVQGDRRCRSAVQVLVGMARLPLEHGMTLSAPGKTLMGLSPLMLTSFELPPAEAEHFELTIAGEIALRAGALAMAGAVAAPEGGMTREELLSLKLLRPQSAWMHLLEACPAWMESDDLEPAASD